MEMAPLGSVGRIGLFVSKRGALATAFTVATCGFMPELLTRPK